jgi:hypothetical protein
LEVGNCTAAIEQAIACPRPYIDLPVEYHYDEERARQLRVMAEAVLSKEPSECLRDEIESDLQIFNRFIVNCSQHINVAFILPPSFFSLHFPVSSWSASRGFNS